MPPKSATIAATSAANTTLYDNALFHTQVTDLAWDEARQLWIVRTDRGDAFTAKYVAMGTGPLHVAKLPGLPGIELFEGKSFHTSRWDYGYTGGTPEGEPMTGLADKRVAVIGTGATAVQVVPNVARDAQELYVFQRTPSSVDRAQQPPAGARLVRQRHRPRLAEDVAGKFRRQSRRRLSGRRSGR